MRNIIQFRKYIINKYNLKNNGSGFFIHEKELYGDTVIILGGIEIVPKRHGIGTKVMSELCAYADSRKALIAVTPSSEWGTRIIVLLRFYSKFGFKKNRDDAISETYVRRPT
jgi:hypothetical protein